MTHLRFLLAAALGAIAGLLAFGLAPSYSLIWGLGAGIATFCTIFALESLFLRDEDRDPTIRPSNVPYKKGNSRKPE